MHSKWNEIKEIWYFYDGSGHLTWFYSFDFIGIKGKKAFFMDGQFPASKKKKKEIENYYKKPIKKFG